MNQLASLINSTVKSGEAASAANLEALLQSLVKDLLPVLKGADSNSPNDLLKALMKPGTSPLNPIIPQDPKKIVWFNTPLEMDVVDLTQAQVDKLVSDGKVEPARDNSSSLSISKQVP
ncbi:hypothetical protein MLD52_14770 [Puniceicoccaceae bacterium K14]|nr:hypothetical protein [Puniceicoccaceae bacterium K14]